MPLLFILFLNFPLLAVTHTVSPGESVMTISFRYYGTHQCWQLITGENNITDKNQIAIGQELIIPSVRKCSKKPAPKKLNKAKALRQKFYTIQLAAYNNAEQAYILKKILEDEKIKTRIELVPNGEKAYWYRVRAGLFSTKAEAKLFMKNKKIKDFVSDAYILKTMLKRKSSY